MYFGLSNATREQVVEGVLEILIASRQFTYCPARHNQLVKTILDELIVARQIVLASENTHTIIYTLV